MQKIMLRQFIILSKRHYVIATGKQYSIKEFVNLTASKLNLKLKWVGKGLNEKALSSSNKIIVEVDRNILDLLRLII